MRSFVISIFLYVYESWTLTAELEKRTQAFEMRCYRRILNISYKDHVTKEEVHRKIQPAIGEYNIFISMKKPPPPINYPKSAAMGQKKEFEIAVVNEPSVFEPLKFYCIL